MDLPLFEPAQQASERTPLGGKTAPGRFRNRGDVCDSRTLCDVGGGVNVGTANHVFAFAGSINKMTKTTLTHENVMYHASTIKWAFRAK